MYCKCAYSTLYVHYTLPTFSYILLLRSVAGSYDNEGIAIFCMLFTYYLWIKAVKTGNVLHRLPLDKGGLDFFFNKAWYTFSCCWTWWCLWKICWTVLYKLHIYLFSSNSKLLLVELFYVVLYVYLTIGNIYWEALCSMLTSSCCFWTVLCCCLGNIYWAALCSMAYFYMVSSWGGYVFLINIIPLHVLGTSTRNFPSIIYFFFK